jgi:hypothetical protein
MIRPNTSSGSIPPSHHAIARCCSSVNSTSTHTFLVTRGVPPRAVIAGRSLGPLDTHHGIEFKDAQVGMRIAGLAVVVETTALSNR